METKRINMYSPAGLFLLIIIAYASFLFVSYWNCSKITPEVCKVNRCGFSIFGFKLVIDMKENCCGNKICEFGETYESCTSDCPNCDDVNDCTKDSYDYNKQVCVNELILLCCGNDICEVNENYKSCLKDCPIPMVFEGVGHIAHGKLLDSGEIEFKERDLKHEGSFYMANIELPINFQTKTEDIILHLQCVNKETRYLLFSSIVDKTTHYEFSSPIFFLNDDPQLDCAIRGSAEFSGKDVVFNTGQTSGTKIIEANNRESATVIIQFDFSQIYDRSVYRSGYVIDYSISLECEAGIVAKEPAQSIKIPLNVKYTKS